MDRLGRYGAVAAKARCLWGLRLRAEDYRRMAAARTLPELAGLLRAHPRWGRALEGVDFSDIHRYALEELLRRYHLEEHLRLYPYLNRDDRRFLDAPVLETELSQIMRYLQLARAGRAAEYSYTPSPHLARRSRVNYAALSEATTYDGLIGAVSETGYAAVLRRLKPRAASGGDPGSADAGFPPFTLVEAALFSHHFHALLSLIRARKDPVLRKWLLENVGLEADLQNLAVILRVKRYYPGMEGQYFGYLLPVRRYLTPETLRRLCAAESADAAAAILRETRYRPYFQDRDVQPERLMARIRYEHSLRGIREPSPSVVTPLSLLYLTQIELSNIVHLIECVRYDISPEEALTYVEGI
ncbi:MAG: V-type ATPase subunit [Oscillospiraceae bacterium]|nr:V-type ATPase subunit [Oscillospiraceae bacterium]